MLLSFNKLQQVLLLHFRIFPLEGTALTMEQLKIAAGSKFAESLIRAIFSKRRGPKLKPAVCISPRAMGTLSKCEQICHVDISSGSSRLASVGLTLSDAVDGLQNAGNPQNTKLAQGWTYQWDMEVPCQAIHTAAWCPGRGAAQPPPRHTAQPSTTTETCCCSSQHGTQPTAKEKTELAETNSSERGRGQIRSSSNEHRQGSRGLTLTQTGA
ncbi:uncharacterized protein LOC134102133 isoform X2 [Sardina pilchardus]|uniref:uncharacterized protein LOC134102133 isoform X2 n=1 Tax=Sardina pilchardus TaxID=27697 RepID=UPI002E147D4D